MIFILISLFTCIASFAQYEPLPPYSDPPDGDNFPYPIFDPPGDPVDFPPWGPRDDFPLFIQNKPCTFQAEVIPFRRRELVSEIYEEMCVWFKQSFPDHPLNPEIYLTLVEFVESWDSRDYINDSEELFALFYPMMNLGEVNEVVVLWPPRNGYWENSEEWLASILAHEFFHFFKKSCCFEEFQKLKSFDTSLFEASAYWAQDEFIKRNYGKTLTNYVLVKKDFVEVSDFERVAYFLYGMSMEKYIFNAPIWFGENPTEKFNKLINGLYSFEDRQYR